MNNGRYCDNCDHYLTEKEFVSYGSWSYECEECGFKYNHSSSLSVKEQVDNQFLKG